MSLHFHWFLPTSGDSRDIVGGGHGAATGSAGAIRPADLGDLGQIARSAEQLGLEAVLTPTGACAEGAAGPRPVSSSRPPYRKTFWPNTGADRPSAPSPDRRQKSCGSP
jgi:hypothetical protein